MPYNLQAVKPLVGFFSLLQWDKKRMVSHGILISFILHGIKSMSLKLNPVPWVIGNTFLCFI